MFFVQLRECCFFVFLRCNSLCNIAELGCCCYYKGMKKNTQIFLVKKVYCCSSCCKTQQRKNVIINIIQHESELRPTTKKYRVFLFHFICLLLCVCMCVHRFPCYLLSNKLNVCIRVVRSRRKISLFL